ncbi:NUDIX domain-containing protein [Streptomyces sp. YC504]|uniref:NUDIX domain-containing protein n=1 Tax=Streptomyces mesophilus TaxID=1775132 RepID=A0A6G4XB22_9ACTN|nr:NUDIX domain-containing protein [Streptomyces mesophilus]NGO74739.1 NUDIX domain-containing protein [Streptomyces mesophilus]
MSSLRLRHSARGLILDPADRILLCRFDNPDLVVWSTPGGGVEPGETVREALRRELLEEVGLKLDHDPPHVWRRQVVVAGYGPGYDGALQDYFLVRTHAFDAAGTFTEKQLAAEGIAEFRWWSVREIADHPGPAVFAPRDLATPLSALLTEGAPEQPVILGL